MSLDAIYKQRQRERAAESQEADAVWATAQSEFTGAARAVHDHVRESCVALQENQQSVADATADLGTQVQALHSQVAAWGSMLQDLNSAFMELGDLEHYTRVIANKAEVVAMALARFALRVAGTDGTAHTTLFTAPTTTETGAELIWHAPLSFPSASAFGKCGTVELVTKSGGEVADQATFAVPTTSAGEAEGVWIEMASGMRVLVVVHHETEGEHVGAGDRAIAETVLGTLAKPVVYVLAKILGF
ncbi:biogenesis of lysosome- organelles complex 1 subunit 1 [Blastocladiella emersonii ATCC 22665]|nr:biogenesis of lysosome- organelles complex 1 subunit 1 [Blastocladiella emersonii ATCC 22665]